MREIKFRAWWKRGKTLLTQANQGSEQWDAIARWIHYNGDDYEVMQFTGLKDKNGREIYEGDIVEFKSEYVGCDEKGHKVRKVKSVRQAATFENGSFYLRTGVSEGEVIGNIYENRNLLNRQHAQ